MILGIDLQEDDAVARDWCVWEGINILPHNVTKKKNLLILNCLSEYAIHFK